MLGVLGAKQAVNKSTEGGENNKHRSQNNTKNSKHNSLLTHRKIAVIK
ncbi:hypothetical protein VCHA49P379_110074 [Vibrio chagasii]|nr:hypothetical protein VCHA49P379_110074 [Vibrio chagasii]